MNFDSLQLAVLEELGLIDYRLRDATALDSGLLEQLARAAGVPAERFLALPDLTAQAARMGRDPQARRALWLQLRALRKTPA